MYLLDTNVVSELRKQSKAHPNVIAWFEAAPPSLLYISVITLAELEMGVLRLDRHDGRQAIMIRTWFEKIKGEFAERCLSIDEDVALRFAQLQVPDKRPERDCWIAATSIVRGLTIVTRNEADFAAMGVAVINPWVKGD